MKNIFILIIVCSSQNIFGQELTKEKIDLEYLETLNNLDNYYQLFIVDTIQEGTVDTIFYYFKDNQIKYINHLSISGGLAMIEGRSQDELFFIDDNLVFMRYFSRSDRLEYGNSDKSTTAVSEHLTYLKSNGECLIQYYPRKAEGTRLTFMENLEKTPLKVRDCMYFSPDTNKSGNKYIEKLVEKYPECRYLLE